MSRLNRLIEHVMAVNDVEILAYERLDEVARKKGVATNHMFQMVCARYIKDIVDNVEISTHELIKHRADRFGQTRSACLMGSRWYIPLFKREKAAAIINKGLDLMDASP